VIEIASSVKPQPRIGGGVFEDFSEMPTVVGLVDREKSLARPSGFLVGTIMIKTSITECLGAFLIGIWPHLDVPAACHLFRSLNRFLLCGMEFTMLRFLLPCCGETGSI
jgi:hypothetical protein